MINLAKIAPGKTWRNFWLAQNIQGAHWPDSVPNGQAITLTNAAVKRTTADGVHFIAGVDTSNVKFADPYDAVNDLYESFFFTPDQDFSSANSTDQYLFGKYVDATNFLVVYLRASDGKLVMSHREGNGAEDIVSAETSWTAGTKYHCLWSCNTGEGQRLIIDGGIAVVEAGNNTAISLIADVTFGARDDGTSTEGFGGVIHGQVVMGGGTDVELTTTADTGEEALLAKGIPPASAKAVNLFTMDEGRGVTANDRGTGADNATLDSSCTWSYTARQAVMSVDGINDYGVSSSGMDVSGDVSIIWVSKMKSTYVGMAGDKQFYSFGKDTNNAYWLLLSTSGTDGINFLPRITGGGLSLKATSFPSIDDYMIIIAVSHLNGDAELYLDTVLEDSGTGGGQMPGDPATAYIAARNNASTFDVSQPILVGFIGGALTGQEVLNLSRYINNWLGLGLTI